MHKTFNLLPSYFIVMTLSMAGLKLVGHTPELSWLAVFAPVMLLPVLALIAVVLFGIALLLMDGCAVLRALVRHLFRRLVRTLQTLQTHFTRTTPPKE